MARTRRNYRPLLALSALLYAGLASVGIAYSFLSEGHPPEITLRYGNQYVEKLIAAGEYPEVMRQLRLALEIEFTNDAPAPLLASIARKQGDLETEIYALRKIHDADPRSVDGHNALSEALLRREPLRPADAQEVIAHGEVVLRLDPHSALAHLYSSRAYAALGDAARAEEHAREARRLDPEFDWSAQGLPR